MSTHNISFYGELMEIILQLSPNTLFICSNVTILNAMLLLYIIYMGKHIICWANFVSYSILICIHLAQKNDIAAITDKLWSFQIGFL